MCLVVVAAVELVVFVGEAVVWFSVVLAVVVVGGWDNDHCLHLKVAFLHWTSAFYREREEV